MEIWKDIEGYEGLYQVSSLGNVRRLYSKTYPYPRLLKQSLRRGYLSVDLCKDSIRKTVSVHRLVAECFIPNPENYEQVNHIDENKMNNCFQNLEWCTCSQNINHSLSLHPERIDRMRKRLPKGWKKGKPRFHLQKVALVDENWDVIEQFENAVDASNKLNINCGYITTVCNRNINKKFRHKTDGKIFVYLED